MEKLKIAMMSMTHGHTRHAGMLGILIRLETADCLAPALQPDIREPGHR